MNTSRDTVVEHEPAIAPRPLSRLTYKILSINIVTLAVLAMSFSYIAQTRENLISNEVENFGTEARIYSMVLLRHRADLRRQGDEAGWVTLNDISIFEYHDTFSIYAALQLEPVGFAIKGKGWKLAADGEIGLQGSIPCATMGGMKARGFPGGAAGVYQAVKRRSSFGVVRKRIKARMRRPR